MTMIPTSSTKTFTQVFENFDSFKDSYDATTFAGAITDNNLEILYYLLYARFANSPITNFDVNQFKYKMFGIIWQYGPTWEKRLEIQDSIRSLSNDDLLQGAKAIYNHAANPGTDPTTSTLEELNYIDSQNTTNYKRSKMDAYAQLWTILISDVTENFLDRFKPLFKKFISPYTELYVEEI